MTFGINELPETPTESALQAPIAEAPKRPYIAASVADALHERAADMRLAAILNAIAVAKAHGLSPEWTEGDAARLRKMLVMTDAIAGGSNDAETIPQGFGPAVRARQTDAMLRAMAEVAANGEAAEAGTEGGQT